MTVTEVRPVMWCKRCGRPFYRGVTLLVAQIEQHYRLVHGSIPLQDIEN